MGLLDFRMSGVPSLSGVPSTFSLAEDTRDYSAIVALTYPVGGSHAEGFAVILRPTADRNKIT